MSDDDTAKADTPADPKTITETKPVDPLQQRAQTERKFEA